MAVAQAEQGWSTDLPVAAWTDDDAAWPWDDEAPEPGPLPPDPLDGAAFAPERLPGMAPGPHLARVLEGIDPASLDEYDLVEMIAGYQRVAAWAQSSMAHLAARLSRRPALNPRSPLPGDDTTLDVTAEELAPRLGVSRFAARRLVDAGRAFRLRLEDTAAALHEGRIDYPKACVLLRLLADQPDDVAWEVQQLVLPHAPHQTVTQLERAVSLAVIAVDPHRATARARAARRGRRVDHPRALPDGMASLYAVLPATDAVGLDLALEAAARTARAAGDSRTIDQLRADALALLGHAALEQGFVGVPGSGPAGEPDQDRSRRDRSTDGRPSPAPEPSLSAAPDSPPGEHGPNVPAFDVGNTFLRTPHLPIGTIGGRRAQVNVTVPLSVLLPPEVLQVPRTPACQSRGDNCAHCGSVQPPSAPPVVTDSRPPRGLADPSPPSGVADPSPPPGVRSPQELPDAPPPDDLPPDWYPGPTPAEVAVLEGYGPITPDVARALALRGGTWRRLVTDPLSGRLLDVGRTRYRPPAALAELVRLRDRTCVSPTCTSPARGCELDHVEPWHAGGATSSDNLATVCARDHRVKSTGAFGLEHLGDGTFVWTTATGHRYRRDHTGRITHLTAHVHPGDPPF
ncbi:DUF222 domain-containing protein [Georgenia sp. 311]|uniref:HNH endonuclease signature motif containing protein n=1 Tax=Georgenia sp. 311 TaxID=2585134 RepID=UPI0011120253|nr:HNH endonuclease signature motif containing protein [Georgenia sp. 311]TNC17087.1 DUF222 domain-containing protein [Georgenia sp. 311]